MKKYHRCATENELLSEFAELVNKTTRLLLPYKEHPVVDPVEKSITCNIEWSSEGNQCSLGIAIWESDSNLIAHREGSDRDEQEVTPQEAIGWLESELAIHKDKILGN